MTNREKYAEQILDIACSGNRIAVNEKTGEPVECDTFNCHECEFNRYFGTCKMHIEHWCETEYVEPQIDWSKVPVDTPILVKDDESDGWLRRYFAKYENNCVYAWDGGADSWSAENKISNTCDWQYAKLAEDGEQR